MLPPNVPGIPLKNSKSVIELSSQNLDIVESFTAPPIVKIFSSFAIAYLFEASLLT